MSYITTTDGIRLYNKDWGNGRPVVLIHGWPLSADTWDDVALALTEAGYRVIAYDRRGFGRSDQPYSGYDYNTLTDDLASVIAAKSLRETAIIGFSMGGGEVARYLSRHSGQHVVQAGLISSVVPLLTQSDDNPHGVPSEVMSNMAQAMKTDRPQFFAQFFEDFFGVSQSSDGVSRETLEWARAIAMQASLKAILDCATSFATTDFRADLAAVDVPTLVIHGTSDRIVPIDATARALHEKIPGIWYREVDGAPHGLFATHKETLIEELLSFLKS